MNRQLHGLTRYLIRKQLENGCLSDPLVTPILPATVDSSLPTKSDTCPAYCPNPDSADRVLEAATLTRGYSVCGAVVTRPPDTETMSRRDKEVRVNEADLSALKTARDQIDSSLALGAVARLGARQLLADGEEEEEVVFA